MESPAIPPKQPPTVRIFISSPGDVAAERALAREIVDSLQKRYAGQLRLSAILWEDLPLAANASFQEGIDTILSEGQRIDIAVFLLWAKLGTPLTVQRPDGQPYRSGTEREFDLMLAASHASPDGAPTTLAYIRDDAAGFQDLLPNKSTAEIREMVDQKALVEAFIEERVTCPETGLNARAFHRYGKPYEFAQRFRVHLQALLDARVGAQYGSVAWEGPPFRGLEAFEREHAAIFNGRETEVADVVVNLLGRGAAGCASLVIAGASGAGKSSLVRAGVIPALMENLGPDARDWRCAVLQPGTAGLAPLERLARAILATLHPEGEVAEEGDPGDERALAQALQVSASTAYDLNIRPALRRLEDGGRPAHLLIFVDQLEELVTRPGAGDESVSAFLGALDTLARSGRVSVLSTVRSDFYAQLQEFESFVALKQGDGLYDLRLPTPSAMQRMIRRPAMLAGLRFEEDPASGRSLDNAILDDASDHPEALPLLQFALRELFEQRTREGLLTFAAYRELGGVTGALSQRAEQVFGALSGEAQQALGSVLSGLVTIDEEDGSVAARQQAALAGLRRSAGADEFITRFTEERLLVAGRTAAGEPIVEVAHEALLRIWERAVVWVEANRSFLAARARIQRDLDLWRLEGCHDDYLIAPGKPLEDARDVLASHADRLTRDQADYVASSLQHHGKRERKRARAVRVAAGVFLLLAILAGVGGIFAWIQRNHARQEVAKNQELNTELEDQLYENRIAVAERELTQDHDTDLASNLLENCPERLRGWEWRYLMQRRDRAPVEVRHDRGVWTANFSPDGTRFVTASVDGTARVWDAFDGTEELSFEEHNTLASALPGGLGKLAPKGLLATKKLRSWLPSASIPDITVKCAAFSPSGRLVASGSLAPRLDDLRLSKGVILLWDAESGEVVRTFDDHVGIVLALTFDPSGKRIASSSMNSDYTFKVWDVETGEVLGVGAGHSGHVYQLAFSPDGERLASAGIDGGIKLWDAETLEELHSIDAHPAPVMDVVFAPDGRTLASAGQDGTVRLWEADSGAPGHVLRGHMGSALSVAYHPSGERLASSGFDKTVRLWDPHTGRPKITLRGHDDTVWDVAFSPDGTRLVSASYDDTALLWDAGERPEPQRPGTFVVSGHSDRVNCVEFSPARDLLASSSWDNDIRLWNGSTGELERVLSGHEGAVWGIAFNADASLLASAGWDHTVRVWNTATGASVAVWRDNEAPVQDVVFTPDGRSVIATSWDGLLKVRDVASGETVQVLDASLFPLLGLDVHPDGTQVVTASGDRILRVWDLASGAELFAVEAHQANIYDVAFSPDGRRIATSSWDMTAKVWDAQTERAMGPEERELVAFEQHTDRVFGLAFSPDGERIATGGGDKLVRIWDARTGKALDPPLRHRGVVWGVAFDPSGGRVATASWTEDGWVRSWYVD